MGATPPRQFERVISGQLRMLLAQSASGAVQPRHKRRSRTGTDTRPAAADTLATIDRKAGHLVPLVPYYSVEAWLLQNTVEAARICSEEHGEPAHLDTFERFRADRALLDEIVKPKEATCLGSKHNRTLASQGLPRPRGRWDRQVVPCGRGGAARLL